MIKHSNNGLNMTMNKITKILINGTYFSSRVYFNSSTSTSRFHLIFLSLFIMLESVRGLRKLTKERLKTWFDVVVVIVVVIVVVVDEDDNVVSINIPR